MRQVSVEWKYSNIDVVAMQRVEVSGVKAVMKVALTVVVLVAATCLAEEVVPDAQVLPLSCPAKCRRNKARSVCGSNGRTYDSNCALLRARCRDPSIELKHVGPCAESGKCINEQRLAMRKAKKEEGVFVPRCLQDGSFAPVQCHESTGYCFCLQRTGVPIPGSAVKNQIPKCSGGCRGKKLKRFVKGIVKDFKKEFRRASESRRSKGASKKVPRSKRSSRAIMYKFRVLDKDSNGLLSKAEYQKLRSIVRKKLKPKKCAKSFPMMCDTDRDSAISEREWSSCLDTTGGSQRNSSYSPSQGENKGPRTGLTYKKVDEAIPACLRERDVILDMAMENTNTSMYLPNCTEDGHFVSKQCYGSAGKNLWYCWCVDEFSGKVLYGTSTEGNCTQRTWKGCPREKQHHFLQDLQRFLNNSLTPDGLAEIRSTKDQKEEKGELVEGKQQTDGWRRKVATYYFNSFDKNSNDVLERRELKKLKKFVLKEKALKRCGRQLIDFCDGDDNGKVTKIEWTSCVAPGGGLVVIATAEPSTGTHRNSSINPFIDLLRPEDDESNTGGGGGGGGGGGREV